MRWNELPDSAVTIRAARIETGSRIIELRVAWGYAAGRMIRWLAVRWQEVGAGNWESRVIQFTGRNLDRALTAFEKNVADGRALGATVRTGRTMRDVWGK